MEQPRINGLVVLYISVTLDILAVGTVIPLLPYYVSNLGAETWVYGLLGTIYGLAQLIGSPLMGGMSDSRGRKTALMVSLVGSALGYLIIGVANNLWLLVFSRIPVGLVKQTMTISKAYITDVSEPQTRAKTLGLISTAASLGFIIGPALGGQLSSIDIRYPAYFACTLFIIDLLFTYFFLPDSQVKSPANQPARKLSVDTFFQVLRMPIVGSLLMIHFIFSFSHTLFRSNFSVYTKDNFGLDPKANGFVLSYIGIWDVITQAIVIGQLTKTFSEAKLISFAIIVATFSYIGMAFASSLSTFLVVLIPFVLATSITNTCTTSIVTKLIKREDIGMTLGVSDSLDSLGRVAAPTIGSYIIGKVGANGCPACSALVSAGLSLYVFFYMETNQSTFKQHTI